MSAKPIEAHRVSIAAAIATGDSFRQHSAVFWNQVLAAKGAADEVAERNLGELVVSATSLALALEIYLKSLLLVLNQDTPQVHDLSTLLDRVPKKVRQAIESEYERLRKAEEPEDTSGVSVHVMQGGGETPSFDRTGVVSMALGALLKRNATAFVTWRYLFAHGTTKSGAPLRFEYVRLNYAASAIRHELAKHNGNKQGNAGVA